MSRFEDRTTNWFTEGETAENLMATDVLEPQRKPLWPVVLGGVAGATALAACAFVLVGHRPALPVVAARQVPVAAAAQQPVAAVEPVRAAAEPDPAAVEPAVVEPAPVAAAE